MSTYAIKPFDAPETEQAIPREPIEGRMYLGVSAAGFGRLGRYEGDGAWIETTEGRAISMDGYDHLLEMPPPAKIIVDGR